MDRFEKEAADWDNNADIQSINRNIAVSVLPSLLQSTDTVLELGCATGILTFMAYKLVSEWYGIDTSRAMIDALHRYRDLKRVEFPSNGRCALCRQT